TVSWASWAVSLQAGALPPELPTEVIGADPPHRRTQSPRALARPLRRYSSAGAREPGATILVPGQDSFSGNEFVEVISLLVSVGPADESAVVHVQPAPGEAEFGPQH